MAIARWGNPHQGPDGVRDAFLSRGNGLVLSNPIKFGFFGSQCPQSPLVGC